MDMEVFVFLSNFLPDFLPILVPRLEEANFYVFALFEMDRVNESHLT